ncbi:MAG: hypothetical protein AAGM46_11250 [Cyanobacteria bacterium J06582_2]
MRLKPFSQNYLCCNCDRALQLQDESMEYDASLYYAGLRSLF